MAGAPKFVDSKILQRKVLLFTKRGDPFCCKARNILEMYKMPPDTYEVVEIDRRQDCAQIENHFLIICLASQRVVPRLFVSGKYIGSEPEIRRLHTAGSLSRILGATLEVKAGMDSLPCLDNSQSVFSLAPCAPDPPIPCLDGTQSVISMVGPCT